MAGKAKTFKFGLKGAENARAGRYAGPIPPSGTYRCKIGRIGIRDNSKGDKMLFGVLEINDKENKIYNGYGFWFQQNITNQGAGFVNDFLRALVPEDDADEIVRLFWQIGPTCVPDEKGFMHVKKIGGFKINSPGTDLEIMVAARFRKSKQYGDKLEASGYARASDFEAAAEEDEWEEEDDVEQEDVGARSSGGSRGGSRSDIAEASSDDDDDDSSAEDVDYDDESDDDEPPF